MSSLRWNDCPVCGGTGVQFAWNTQGGASDIPNFITEKIAAGRKNGELFSRGSEFDKLSEKSISLPDGQIQHVLEIVGYKKYSVHTYFPLGQDAFIAHTLGVTESFVRKEMRENAEAAKHLRSRGNAEIPTEPGICIDGAFSQIETPWEGIEFGVRLKEYPDVHFSVQIIKNGAGVQPVHLIRNVAEARIEAKAAGIRAWVDRVETLRQGKKAVNGWEGEEVLLKLPGEKGSFSAHKFVFRAGGAKHDPFHPLVEITFDTGVKDNKSASVPPSLSDGEAIALWDRYLSSIRVRPTSSTPK